MRRRSIVLCAALVISLSGLTGCGAVENQVKDKAKNEVNKQKKNAENKVKQEVTKAVGGN